VYMSHRFRISTNPRAPRVVLRLLGLVAAFALFGVMGARPVIQVKKAAWTVMIYQAIDNGLEAPGIKNLKEMVQVGGGDNVQVIVLCDRSPESEPKDQYTDEGISTLKDWSGGRLLQLQKGRLIQVDHWGNTNTGDPETLRRFVTTTAQFYPAEHYALIISDHGSGWSGFCVDESNGDRALALRDLRAGLEPFVKEHGKLDFVGLDACLMGSFETAQALAPVAHVMVGSEEVAPARGWNWDVMLKTLNEKPTATAYDLGRATIDAYTIHFNETQDPLAQFSSMGCTLSMIDLDKFDALQTAVAVLGDKCTDAMRNEKRKGWVKVARARARAEEYGPVDEEMHDLIHLTEILQASGDPAIAQAAKEVEVAAKRAITYLMRGPLRPHAGGLSIYFPIDGIDLKDEIGAEYMGRTFSQESRWVNFLSLYSVALDSFADVPHLLPVQKSGDVATLEKPVEIVAKTTADDIDKAYFIVIARNGPDLLLVGRMPQRVQPDGVMGARFRGMWFMLHDKEKALTCPITSFEAVDDQQTSLLAHVPAQLRHAGSEWQDVLLTFHVKMEARPSGQLIYIFADTDQGPLHVPLLRGDQIRPVYTKVTPNGEVGTWVPSKPGSYVEVEDPRDFSLGWGQIGKGAYEVGFQIINLAGLMDLDFTDVVLQ
jgi:hypothetical protein